jgi:hypothetical protein
MLYIGLDLTDPYAKRRRPVARAVITETLEVALSEWEYESAGIGMVADEANVVVAIDGPQGLAKNGAKMRECERLLGAAGKTPDHLPMLDGRPFVGFIRGSVELFRELVKRLRLVEDPDDMSSRLIEVYPGAAWPVLAGEQRLPRKTTKAGRMLRKQTLEARGVRFPSELPTHDELDATLAAYIAWRFNKKEAECVGMKPFYDGGFLREGYIVQPLLLSGRPLSGDPNSGPAPLPRR